MVYNDYIDEDEEDCSDNFGEDEDIFDDDSFLSGFEEDTESKPRKKKPKSAGTVKEIPLTYQPTTGPDIINSLARAIQHHEGWFPPSPSYPRGSQSYRNNNPGNLRYIGQATAIGKSTTGFAIFSDYATGYEALLNDLRFKLKKYPQLTIRELLNIYAPPTENDTGAYIQAVADELGISANEQLQ